MWSCCRFYGLHNSHKPGRSDAASVAILTRYPAGTLVRFTTVRGGWLPQAGSRNESIQCILSYHFHTIEFFRHRKIHQFLSSKFQQKLNYSKNNQLRNTSIPNFVDSTLARKVGGTLIFELSVIWLKFKVTAKVTIDGHIYDLAFKRHVCFSAIGPSLPEIQQIKYFTLTIQCHGQINNSDVKQWNTPNCLDQYTCRGLRLWNSVFPAVVKPKILNF